MTPSVKLLHHSVVTPQKTHTQTQSLFHSFLLESCWGHVTSFYNHMSSLYRQSSKKG